MRILGLVILAILLLGCAQGTLVASPTAAPTPEPVASPTMIPSATAVPSPTAVVNSTPLPGKGNVVGTIFRVPMGLAAEPMSETKLYLAEMLRNAEGNLSGLAGVDEERAPSAWTDAQGYFAFQDVQPGHYALIIKHPISLILAHDKEVGQDVVVEVVAGEIQELGIIQVEITE